MQLLARLTLLALVFPALAAAQPTPLTPVFPVSGTAGAQYLSSVAAEADGDSVVAWTSWVGETRTILFRRFDAAGEPTTGILQASVTPVTQFFSGPEVEIHAATGNFLIVWEDAGARLLGRVFDRAGTPLTAEIEIFRAADISFRDALLPSLAATPSGFVAAWSALLDEQGTLGIFARRLDPAGGLAGPEIQAAEGEGFTDPSVAADAEGRFVVVWIARNQRRGVWGRIFDPDGTPRSGDLLLEGPPFLPAMPEVAFGPDGGFLATWSAFTAGVLARGFDSDGTPRGPSVRVSPRRAGTDPTVAPDGHGGFAIFWSYYRDFTDRGVGGRVAGASGTPRGPAFLFGGQTTNSAVPSVAAGPPGQLTVAWSRLFNSSVAGVAGQRFVVPPPTGADPCVVRDGRLVCDTLRNEGSAALEVALTFRPGGVPLLGNFNGDEQDDLCVYRDGSFFCDLDHNGRPDATFVFGGQTGDAPLLGDVNGDGRDDACLRRVRRFTCDTARNGGSGEVQIVFGLRTDLPLLGDVDGDGDDDPCLYRRDRFLCDTAHDGKGAEVAVIFGLPGDVPLLGDVDADGDEDFCVFRGERFLCDTAHDGGAAELEFLFGEPGAIPLLGNVDGF